jgi:hypothetical protein
MGAARPGKAVGRKLRKRRVCHGRQASLRVVFFGHPGFVGVGGWEVVAGRDVDLEVGGFVAGELLVNGGEGAEEQAGDVGESGGAASGDVAAGEEPKEMGEGMVAFRSRTLVSALFQTQRPDALLRPKGAARARQRERVLESVGCIYALGPSTEDP